jgi:hypothetical protein
MATILGLDLGKFKSAACAYDADTTARRFTPVPTEPHDFRRLLAAERRLDALGAADERVRLLRKRAGSRPRIVDWTPGCAGDGERSARGGRAWKEKETGRA